MPLITCPDCGAQVSQHAPACPQCGWVLARHMRAVRRATTARALRDALAGALRTPPLPATHGRTRDDFGHKVGTTALNHATSHRNKDSVNGYGIVLHAIGYLARK
jgi:hypothetical protein